MSFSHWCRQWWILDIILRSLLGMWKLILLIFTLWQNHCIILILEMIVSASCLSWWYSLCLTFTFMFVIISWSRGLTITINVLAIKLRNLPPRFYCSTCFISWPIGTTATSLILSDCYDFLCIWKLLLFMNNSHHIL